MRLAVAWGRYESKEYLGQEKQNPQRPVAAGE